MELRDFSVSFLLTFQDSSFALSAPMFLVGCPDVTKIGEVVVATRILLVSLELLKEPILPRL